jgi:DNA-binding transcriptional LysR family regulator
LPAGVPQSGEPLLNTRFLEAFCWAARLGSFRAAADKLSITQAAVSNRIATLEQDFNTRLFDRDVRETRLTFEGRRLLSYAERMLDLNREMHRFNKATADIAGVVRIGVVETVVHTWLTDFLKRIQSTYPAIELQLTSESTERLHERLAQRALDIAIQTDPVISDGVRNIASGAIAMGWVGRAEEWSSVVAPVGFEQLVQRPIITMNRGSQPHSALLELCETHNVSTPRIHFVSSISAIVKLVEADFGLAVMPLAAASGQIERGSLSIIDSDVHLRSQRMVVSYCTDLTTEAIQLVAKIACEEAARFAVSLAPEYGHQPHD